MVGGGGAGAEGLEEMGEKDQEMKKKGERGGAVRKEER